MAETLTLSIALPASHPTVNDWRAQLLDTAGVNVGSAVSTGFVIVGSGFYEWTYAAFPDGFRGGVKFYSNATPATVKGFVALNPAAHVPTTTEIQQALAGYTITVIPALVGSQIAVYRGTTWTVNLVVGDISSNSKVWFSVKDDLSKPDTDAFLQVEKTAGLVRFNGAAGTASEATLVVNNAATGDITITVKASTTLNAALTRGLAFDVKVLVGTVVTEKARGTFDVLGDVTRAVS